MAKLHLGLSGYDYKDWQGEGLFYPPKLPKAKYLEHYSRRVTSLESNGTFQKSPSEATVAKWMKETPAEFTISPKMVQHVSHFKRLSDEAIKIAKEFLDPLDPLYNAGKLGPIFLQLPPNFARKDELLDRFLTEMLAYKPYRWAIEFRNASWNNDETESLLRKHGVAWIAAEDEEPAQLRDTANFTFTRLRKLEYTDAELIAWADRFNGWLAEGKDCFVYCRHKDTVEPWKWADRLQELVG